MITLRPDQEQAVADLQAAFRAGRMAPLLCAPTGMGKTVVSAEIARRTAARGKRIMFTVHREELLTQTSKTFTAFGIEHGFVKSGMTYDNRPLVHIASIDTLRNRLELVKPPDLLVIDEAHLARANTWHQVIAHFRSLGARVMGNSGSPRRLDGKSLGDLFDALVMGPSVAWLIEHGHLSRYKYFAPSCPDMTGIGKRMGDYDKGALAAAADTAPLLGDIVGQWRAKARGLRTLAFTVSHAHSEHLVDAFRAAGITAASIDSKSSKPQRRQLIEDFADRRIQVLANVELVTTGFDLAASVGRDVTVEAVILARPTQSLALFLQMCGRGLRAKDDPCIFLDHAGNSGRHGWPDDDREWSLEDEEDGKSATKNKPAPLTCETCYQQVRQPAPMHCPHCGTAWPRGEGARSFEADTTVELEEVTEADRMAARRQRVGEEGRCKTYEEFVALGKARGYPKPEAWAGHRMKARQGRRA